MRYVIQSHNLSHRNLCKGYEIVDKNIDYLQITLDIQLF